MIEIKAILFVIGELLPVAFAFFLAFVAIRLLRESLSIDPKLTKAELEHIEQKYGHYDDEPF